MLASSRDARGRGVTRGALVVALALCTGLSARPADACSGPYYSGPAVVPITGSTDVPVNTLIQVEDELGVDDTLSVALASDGVIRETLTLTRHLEHALFVGSPAEPLASHTEYAVLVDRSRYCSWLPPVTISNECNANFREDQLVVLTRFRTSDVVDQVSPVAGDGRARFSYGPIEHSGPSTCFGFPRGSWVEISADESGWVASDDGGIAGYRLVRDGEAASVLQPTPFPQGSMRCSGGVAAGLRPGTYQVIAEDYLGNQTMLSRASVLRDGCESLVCTVTPGPRPARALGLGAFVLLAAVWRAARRSNPRHAPA